MKNLNKPQSVQGISAKTLEDISMYSDNGHQTATASEYAKRVTLDSTSIKNNEKKYIWDKWFSNKTKIIITSIIAITIFIVTIILPIMDRLVSAISHPMKITQSDSNKK